MGGWARDERTRDEGQTPEGEATVLGLSLGCMGMSNSYRRASETESIATIRRALDLGVTLLETTDIYGEGHNESLVGRAIAGRRAEAVIATKVGLTNGPDGFRLRGRPDRIAGAC